MFFLKAIALKATKVDENYYLVRYPDIQNELNERSPSAHFRNIGWKEGRSPSASLNTVRYLCGDGSLNGSSGDQIKLLMQGAAGDRSLPSRLRKFAETYCKVADSGFFDRDFYLANYKDVVGDPVEHYIRHGWRVGYDPGPNFVTSKYLEAYPDVIAFGDNPIIHYVKYGRDEQRRTFSTQHVSIDPEPEAVPFSPPIELYRRTMAQKLRQKLETAGSVAVLPAGPLISILVPVYNVERAWLDQMVASVQNQSYHNWQLCMIDDCSSDPSVTENLRRYASADPRITVGYRRFNGGISQATNDCLAIAAGSYVALLDNDDMLTCDALEEMVRAILQNDKPDWLYSDEFKIDQYNEVSELFAKPDWSPLMLLNYMYTGHLTLYKKSIVDDLGGFRSKFDFSQDYDLALRISEVPGIRVVHVEKYLYAWRMIAASAAMGGKPTARISNIAALQDAIDRRGWNGIAEALPTANRVRRRLDHTPKVSIVIPSDNEQNIAASVDSILSQTSYKYYEIIIVTNSKIISTMESKYVRYHVNWQPYDLAFNFSDKCNRGVEAATGSVVAFFNDDVRVLTCDWIEALLEYLTLPDVGVVGPKLLYENGLIQHGGMATGMRRLVGTAFHCYPDDSPVHFNFVQCVRETSLICGALLAMPVALFRQIGGYDAVNAPIGHSDVDLCFRVREAGYRCVYTPYAKLVHIGHASIGDEKKVPKAFRRDKSEVFLLKRFGALVANDPYFTKAMRDLVYIDSPQDFVVHPGKQEDCERDVLVLSHDLTTSGAPKVAFDLALLFRSRGYFVTVMSPADGPYRERLVEAGVTVVIDELILTGNEDSMVLARSFDMVIANTIVCWQTVGELAKTTPVYLYSHETELVRHFAGVYPGFLPAVKSATAVWCGSERATDAMAAYGIQANILEYGVDDIGTDASTAKLQIALFGSIEPRKGQDLAILGMGYVERSLAQKAQLTLYGRTLDAGFQVDIAQLAAGHQNVRFGGELLYDEYRATLMAADIVIVCSRDDTLPLVSLDALALGKPLICSRTTGTSKYLRQGESGIILEHNSPQEIGAAYNNLIASAEVRRTLGEGARTVFLRHFTQAAFADRVFACI